MWSEKQDQESVVLPFRDQKIVGGKECCVTKNMCSHLFIFGVNSMEGYYARWYHNEVLQLSGIRICLFCNKK